MPTQRAELVIDEQIRALRRQHPNETETWYLEKLMEDLVRDRR
jgi:hypothetical protein